MNFIDACKELISIDTSPSNGTGQACNFIETLAKDMGLQVVRDEEIQRGIAQANIICSPMKVDTNVHLMLQTHLDTVNPGSFALWEKTGRSPFQASIRDNKIFGLGAVDTKLDFLCKLYAAYKLKDKALSKTFAVIGTYGEEYNMQGAVHLMRHKKLKAECALVGEPTNFNLVYSGKGLANIEITIPFSQEEIKSRADHDAGESLSTQTKIFKGVAAHSSSPEKGENAIEKLINYLRNLPEEILVLDIDGGTNFNTIPIQAVLEFDMHPFGQPTVNQKLISIFDMISNLKKDFTRFKDSSFDPPITTFNIGMARTYSDHMKLMGCVRWPPKVKEETYLSWVNQLKEHCESHGAVFRIRDFKRPFLTESSSSFAQNCLESIKNLQPDAELATQPVTNEASVFSRFKVETLVFGPGIREGNAHTPNESVDIQDLQRATEIYQNIIEKICS